MKKEIIQSASGLSLEVASIFCPIIAPIKNSIVEANNITNYLFVEKIQNLIWGYESLEKEKLENIKIDFWEDDKNKKIDNTILNVLNLYETNEKAFYTGKLLYKLICDCIDRTTFLRICKIIANISHEDLLMLKKIEEDKLLEDYRKYDVITLNIFKANGLLEEHETHMTDLEYSKFNYCTLSEYGKIIKDLFD